MSEIIKSFYEAHNFPQILIPQKLELFARHKDIAAEFEKWIQSGTFVEDDPVEVKGYTAKKLADLSGFLKGDGAFGMLIELRERPERALGQIEAGFKMK